MKIDCSAKWQWGFNYNDEPHYEATKVLCSLPAPQVAVFYNLSNNHRVQRETN